MGMQLFAYNWRLPAFIWASLCTVGLESFFAHNRSFFAYNWSIFAYNWRSFALCVNMFVWAPKRTVRKKALTVRTKAPTGSKKLHLQMGQLRQHHVIWVSQHSDCIAGTHYWVVASVGLFYYYHCRRNYYISNSPEYSCCNGCCNDSKIYSGEFWSCNDYNFLGEWNLEVGEPELSARRYKSPRFVYSRSMKFSCRPLGLPRKCIDFCPETSETCQSQQEDNSNVTPPRTRATTHETQTTTKT